MAAENLLKQDFQAERPFSKLLTDVTQVQCRDGKLYISPIMDCFGGDILSLEMRDNMKKVVRRYSQRQDGSIPSTRCDSPQ